MAKFNWRQGMVAAGVFTVIVLAMALMTPGKTPRDPSGLKNFSLEPRVKAVLACGYVIAASTIFCVFARTR